MGVFLPDEKSTSKVARSSDCRGVIAIVAMTAITTRRSNGLACADPLAFSSTCLFPSLPIMSHDLNTSVVALNFTVGAYLVVMGVAPLLWAPLATFYGRRPVYLYSTPLFILGSIGVALSNNLAQLLGTRILQGFGASAALSVGVGTLGDCFHPLVRGRAMGWMYGAITFGPAVAPVTAGLFNSMRTVWSEADDRLYVSSMAGNASSFSG